jgi:hypothetical protein
MKVVVENCLIHDAEKEVGREDRTKELSSNGAVAILDFAMMTSDDSCKKSSIHVPNRCTKGLDLSLHPTDSDAGLNALSALGVHTVEMK